ncbi:MAG TPA: DinB family protein [Gemmatimonadales bacterium]|nr:DinB family protein [Gemmatimonadales bacterium]
MFEQIQRLFQHLVWADEQTLIAWQESDGRPPKALELYSQTLGAEHVWLSRIKSTVAEVRVWPTLTLGQCAALAEENHAEFRRRLAPLESLEDSREIQYPNSAGATFQSRIDDVLLHVVMHGSFHRGQVALLIT